MIAQGETIYIQPSKNSSFMVGNHYRVIKTEPIDTNFTGKKFHGVKHIILGIVNVIEINDSYATATMTRSFEDAATGDLIIPFEPASERIMVSQSLDNIDARIISSKANDVILCQHKIAFIDRGTDHGIKPGQIYTLFEEREQPDTPDKAQIKNRDVGKVIVLLAQETASTILVLSSSNEFTPGMLVN